MSTETGKYSINIFTTPISYEAGKNFNESQKRFDADGGDIAAFINTTQENFRGLLNAVAGLEHEIRELKGETDDFVL